LIIDWAQAACTDDIPIVNYLGYPWAVKNTHEIGHLMAKYNYFQKRLIYNNK